MPKVEIDYSNTIIYKIYCKDSTIKELYIGHTTNFVQRKHAHKQSCINEKSSNHQCKLYKVIRENGGWYNWRMEIINFFNCKDHYEAKIKEQEYFESLNATLNSIEPMPKPKDKPIKIIKSFENKIIHKCALCNITCQNENLLDIHNQTKKHIRRLNKKEISESLDIIAGDKMNDKNSQKVLKILRCECCDYECSRKSDFKKHFLSSKHKKNDKIMTNDDKNSQKFLEQWFTCECGKEYKHRQGLWSHKKKCENAASASATAVEEQPSNNLIVELLKQNKEFKDLIIEQNKQIMELAKEKNTVINNTTNNNNTNNNQFNLQFFLNEQCKDALNLMDFVNQIKLQLSDLDMIGRVGYVEGMSKIFLRNLHELDVFKRPIHCSDLKRETLYVKDKDAWEKENGENIKIKQAIKGIENKNIKQIPIWVKENPASEDFETKKHMEYQNILLEAMGGSTSEDDNKKCDKIIRNIAKEVVIDKK
jgi:hypothetical protein